MSRIPHKDFEHHVPDSLGEQVNVNHVACTAGLDTKKRLYIKRTEKNGRDIILAYCHHCGFSGVRMESSHKIKKGRADSRSTHNIQMVMCGSPTMRKELIAAGHSVLEAGQETPE